MTEEQQKEQFSIAYVRAVAAAARVNIYKMEVDADSIDIGFSVKSVAGRPQSPKLDAQLKCVTKLTGNDSEFRFPLPVKNYNELVGDHYTPKILIVVLVPLSPAEWLVQTTDCLSLYHCGYWVSLHTLESSTHVQTVTIGIPRTQLFSQDTLRSLMPTGGTA
jgi:hypothetical protein